MIVVPYCGGCGHLFFNEPKVTMEEAVEKAKTRRCHYCLDDARELEKRAEKHNVSEDYYLPVNYSD